MPKGYVTTHILDTSQGKPAANIPIALYRINEGKAVLVSGDISNQDGRTDNPILPSAKCQTGTYRLVFSAGDYFRTSGLVLEEPLFLDEIIIAFGVSDADAHYHVPLLLSPFGYTTYRGS